MAEGELFGPYRLEEVIGQGGMGEVWRARDTRHGDRVVALKVLRAATATSEEFRTRFAAEADRAAGLQSPHIIPVHSYGEADGRLFIEMTLARGVDLGKLLDRDGPLTPARAVRVVTQVARALDTAHARGLVHRDVKPANVLVDTDADDFAYLVDFGIAKSLDGGTSLTATALAIGSMDYMAPERFSGSADQRVDVYALAALLHVTLTGRPPFDIDSAPQALHAHTSLPPPRPSEIRRGVSPAFDEVVAIGMAKDPSYRYRTAGALAEAAGRALATAPGPAGWQAGPPAGYPPPTYTGPGSTVYGASGPQPARRRKRWPYVLGALALVAVLAGGAVTWVLTDDGAIDPPTPVPIAAIRPAQTVSVATGTKPQGMDVSPDGRFVYAANREARTVSIVDAATNTRVRDVGVGETTTDVVAHPDGRTLYVAVNDGVRVLDAVTGAERRFVPISGGPTQVEVSPDGTTVYAALLYDRAIAKIDTGTLGLTRFRVGGGPEGLAVSRDSETLYVALPDSGKVEVVDPGAEVVRASVPVGAKPRYLALAPDGGMLWVSNEGSGSVSLVDTESNAVVGTLDQLTTPQEIAFSPDGTRAYVSNFGEDTVVPFDPATRQRLPPIPATATAVAVAPDGSRLYSTDFYRNNLVVTGLEPS